MTQAMPDDLWRDFPKTATAFETRFATEEDCRAYWIAARWGGEPSCARCNSTRVWTIREGTTFECADCGHQTSLTSGTLLEKTHKPLKVWFRAIFEISTRRTGISAKDLQRIMGFGSYKTAWSWLHKLRAAMVRSDSEPLGPCMGIVLSRGLRKGAIAQTSFSDHFPSSTAPQAFPRPDRGVLTPARAGRVKAGRSSGHRQARP
jgi:transposase-like protein